MKPQIREPSTSAFAGVYAFRKTGCVRCGYTMLECIVAAGMLSVAFVLTAQLLLWNARERREAWRVQTARVEAANVLERLDALPYDALTAERLGALKMSDEAVGWLPGASLKVSSTDVASPRSGKLLHVDIAWNDASPVAKAPVRLSRWRFAPGGAP